MRNKLFILAITVALGIGSALASAGDDIKSQIEAANAAMVAAFDAGDAAAVAACYTEDAQVMPGGTEPLSGREAIAAFWQGMMDSPAASFTLNSTEVEQHENTAIEVGYAEIFDADGNKIDTLKYIVIWKQVDDKWLLHRDIFNSNTAAG